MKRFLIICVSLLALAGLFAFVFFYTSLSIPFLQPKMQAPVAFTHNKDIYVNVNGKPSLFEIKGVDMGAGIPGHFATEFAIDYDTYLQWFALIQEMNANVVRIYTISDPVLYQALHDYNTGRENPLYLLQGVWVDDSVMRCGKDAFDPAFIQVFQNDCRKAVDVIHGRRSIWYNGRYASGNYRYDVSEWTLGYIIGVEWETDVVLYTDDVRESKASFQGEYLYTDKDATAFESMLARTGNELLRYESTKYGQQRLLAFSNWPETDPLIHEQWRWTQDTNLAHIDVEHIHATDAVSSGMFASYHVYPYFPPFLDFEKAYVNYKDEDGNSNPYLGYLTALNKHHSIPVVISEFGLPSSRGIARINLSMGMNQGHLSETEQAQRLPVLYESIKKAGCAGGIVFEWQDEWFKRTWNTWPMVDLARNAFWNDYQTNEQSFGMITFDPGKEQSIVYVDGDLTDWADTEPLTQNGSLSLKMQYDEKYLYFLVEDDRLTQDTKLYLPLDITPLSGAYADSMHQLTFSRPTDFVICIDGKENSQVFVQEYYDCLYATQRREIWNEDAFLNRPASDSTEFHQILLFLRGKMQFLDGTFSEPWTFPTGKMTYGNGNPSDADFKSLTDFCFGEHAVEIRLPWQLFNFSDPSTMKIHDDYYLNYGVKDRHIDELYVGAMVQEDTGTRSTSYAKLGLKGWGSRPTWHTRKKASYYAMQAAFSQGG